MTKCVLHLQYKASEWGSQDKRKNNHKEQILWSLWRTSLRCRFCKALRRAMMRLLDLALNQKVTTFGAWLLKKKMPKPPQNTSVSSLSLSLFLSLSEGQFTFILPLFKLLTFDSFLFLYVGFINLHCWQEKRSRVWRQDVFHSLCRPGSHAGGVQPSPELFFFFFYYTGTIENVWKLAGVCVVSCGKLLWSCIPRRDKTNYKNWLCWSQVCPLMWVWCVRECVCVCVCARVCAPCSY